MDISLKIIRWGLILNIKYKKQSINKNIKQKFFRCEKYFNLVNKENG